jgi:hypothetical protein
MENEPDDDDDEHDDEHDNTSSTFMPPRNFFNSPGISFPLSCSLFIFRMLVKTYFDTTVELVTTTTCTFLLHSREWLCFHFLYMAFIPN